MWANFSGVLYFLWMIQTFLSRGAASLWILQTTRKFTLQIPFPSLDHFNWELANTLHLCFKTRLILRRAGQLCWETLESLSITFTPICTTWPSFPFTCRLLLIISTHVLVFHAIFHPEDFELFNLLIFYFKKFSTWIWSWRLPYTWSFNSLLITIWSRDKLIHIF